MLFTSSLRWLREKMRRPLYRTSCRPGNIESGKCLQASDSPQHPQTVEHSTSVLWSLNKRQPNVLLGLKQGENMLPPPLIASHGQLQGKFTLCW